MRIAKVLGSVVLSRCHPSFEGAPLRVAAPLSLDELKNDTCHYADTLVVWDERGAGEGSLIVLSESSEAAQPFRPEIKPVDAYNTAILDDLTLHPPTS